MFRHNHARWPPGPTSALPGLRPFPAREKSPQPAFDAGESRARAERFGHNLGRIVEAGSATQPSVGEPPPTFAPIQRRADTLGLEVRPSQIHRKGLFAKRAYNLGEQIGIGASAEDGGEKWEITRAGRYTNHQSQPNAQLTRVGDKMVMAAKKSITADDEVTVDYNQVGRLVGPGRLAWRGQPVPSNAEHFYRKED